jgi:hypothetical protein
MSITLNKNRIFSGLLAAIYIIGGFATGGGEGGFKMLIFVVLPLACIWFGDAMGGYTGSSGSIWITVSSPGFFVSVAGWLLLILPLIVVLIQFLFTHN